MTVPHQPPLQQQRGQLPTQQFPPHVGAQPPPPGAPWGPPAGNPWGPPPPVPRPPAEPQNGFGIAAVVLGGLALASVGLGLTPFLPFVGLALGILLGILALVFGLLGLARARRGLSTNKPLSITGLALGVVATIAGIVLTVIAVIAAVQLARDLQALGDEAPGATQPFAAPAPAAPSEGPSARPSANAVTWEDDVSVEVSEPSSVTFSDTACCPDDLDGVAYTVRIVNDSDEVLEPSALTTSLTADGVEADRVFDTAQGFDTPTDSVAPGDETTFTIGFAAAPGADLVLEISGHDRRPAVFRSED